ncbi:MAG TPA: response regulator [Vicinamibacterales bacterium]|nr:response regulator [Vicinamibacterales bacterium]
MTTKERVNILLVDDQPSKLLTYEEILKDLDENLIKVTSASEALQWLLKEEVAVVLVDVCMPDLDGYELATMIRNHPRHQGTSIIFVSAVLMTDLDLLRGYEKGAVDYVAVPVIPEILRAKVSVFADLHRKTRQLERLNEQLEARVAERTSELEAVARLLRENESRLQDADRRKDEFLAMLAHELRNPLAPIRTSVQLMQIDGLPAAQHERARDIIKRQVDHMVRLIDDLLDVSRISRGQITLKRENVGLNAVVARAVETARPFVEEFGHTLDVELPAASVRLLGDETRLAQVVGNLLHNAAKYTEPGGRIVLSALDDGKGNVAISVRDNGIGIAEEDMHKLFELFSQINAGPEHPRRGLGIGLALVRRLVEMHGGSVRASSEGRGKGCEVVVTLPAGASGRDTAIVPDERLDELVRNGKAGRRLLVVDDNTDAAEGLAMLLVAAGNDVRVAHDGQQCLTIAQTFQPDIIFLDLGMPRMDGWETASRIRASEWGREMRLVALTGWGQPQDRDRTAAAGFDAHLVKPIGAAEVLVLVNDPKMGPVRAAGLRGSGA